MSKHVRFPREELAEAAKTGKVPVVLGVLGRVRGEAHTCLTAKNATILWGFFVELNLLENGGSEATTPEGALAVVLKEIGAPQKEAAR